MKTRKNTRHGTFAFYRNDSIIGRSLDLYGEYSQRELDLLMRFAPTGATIVEVGANIGAFSVPLSKALGPSGHLYCYEAHPLIADLLDENLDANACTNATVVRAAAGADHGVASFTDFAPDSAVNMGAAHIDRSGHGTLEVTVAPIDALNLGACSLIKVDAEGGEADVIIGAQQTLFNHTPVLYVEHDRDDPRLVQCLLTVAEMGYRLFWHKPPLFAADNVFANPTNVFGDVISRNVLCLPPERTLPDGLAHLEPIDP